MTQTAEKTKDKPKPRRRWLRALAGIVSLAALLVILLFAATWGGFYWLNNTAQGQAWVSARLQEAAAASGYEMTVDHARATGPGRFAIARITIADKGGLFAEASDVRIGLSIPALAARQLSLSGFAASATLYRMPESAQDKTDAAAPATTLPDIYFNSFALAPLAIETLTIHQDGGKPPLVFSPELEAQVTALAQTISFDAALSDKAAAQWRPKEARLRGSFALEDGRLTLDKAEVSHDAYAMEGEGTIDTRDAQAFDLTLDIDLDDAAALEVESLKGAAAATAKLQGTPDAPLLDLSGKISGLEYQGHAYEDISIEAGAAPVDEGARGAIAVDTSWQGQSVTLRSDYLYKRDKVTFSAIALRALDLEANGDIEISPDTALAKGKLDMKGGLSALQKIAGLPLDGNITASLQLTPADDLQAASVTLEAKALSYEDWRIAAASASAAYADISTLWPDSLSVQASNITQGDISIPAAKATLQRREDGDYDATLKMQEREYLADADIRARLSALDTAQPAARDIKAQLRLRKNAGDILVRGSAAQEALDLAVSTKNFKPLRLAGDDSARQAQTAIKLDSTIKGSAAAPVISAAFSGEATVPEMDNARIRAQGTLDYSDRKAALELSASGAGIKAFNIKASQPVTLSLMPYEFTLPNDGGLTGDMRIDADLLALGRAFLPAGIALSGKLDAQAGLSGTLQKPALRGQARLAEGRLGVAASGFALNNIDMAAAFDGDRITITRLTADDGSKGRLTGNGRITLDRSLPADIALQLSHMDFLPANNDVNGTLSADVALTGANGDYSLRGKIETDEVTINIPERLNEDIPELNIVEKKEAAGDTPALRNIDLDLSLVADNRIFVRGWGLDAEFGGSLDIKGSLDEPLFSGDFTSVRGRYEEFGRRFDITRAVLQFRGTVPPSPYLDVVAQTKVSDVTAQVKIGGSVKEPAISFSAIPAMPEDQVLSHILFGKDMSTISPFQALELARTLRRFSGRGGGLDPLGELRGAFGLDDLSIQSDAEGGTTVGAGKYISDKVYLQVESGSGDKSGAARLQLELAPNIKAESKIGQDATGGGGIFWEWEY